MHNFQNTPKSERDKPTSPRAYNPHVVSIGPYHHGKQELSMMEEHKWRFLDQFLARSECAGGLNLESYLEAMAKLEDSARACYSEEITMNSKQFVQMLLLDGCFVVELFRKFEKEVEMETQEDPVFYIPWLIAYITRDLLRLENQLPLFVLQHLHDLSNVPDGKPKASFLLIALKFFNWTFDPEKECVGIEWWTKEEHSHLLDLFRATFIPPDLQEREKKNKQEREKKNEPVKLLHCVTKLLRAGIEFTSIEKADTLLDIEFKKGVLRIPHLKIDDITSSFFQNCLAFEQSHRYCGTYFTSFAKFMNCLIDTEQDVALLRDAKVIENYFGADDELTMFFNKLGRDVVFDEKNCYLGKQFDEVNKYYRSSLHVRYAEFKSTYFSSPWSFISAMAALILLIFTVAQTFYTIYAYYHPRK